MPQANQQGLITQPAIGKAAQGTTAAKNMKGPSSSKQPKKRANDEVENVKSQPASQAPPQPLPTVAAPLPARSNFPAREQLAAMPPQQRALLEAQFRRQPNQARVSITKAAAEEAWNHLPDKLKQLYAEIKNNPAPEPVNVSPEEKAAMTQQLKECTDMIGRMDQLVHLIIKTPGQEKAIRTLFGMVSYSLLLNVHD